MPEKFIPKRIKLKKIRRYIVILLLANLPMIKGLEENLIRGIKANGS